MSIINLDFTNIETSSPRMSEGTHRVKVKSAELKRATTGSEMITVTYENTNGEVAYDNFVLTPQALWKLKLFLEALFNTPFTTATQIDTQRFIGRQLIINVKDEAYVNNDGLERVRSAVDTNYRAIAVSDALGGAPAVVTPQPQTPVAPTPAMPQAPVAPQPTFVPPVTPAQPVNPVQPVVAPVAPQPQAAPTPAAPVTPADNTTPARPKFPWEK